MHVPGRALDFISILVFFSLGSGSWTDGWQAPMCPNQECLAPPQSLKVHTVRMHCTAPCTSTSNKYDKGKHEAHPPFFFPFPPFFLHFSSHSWNSGTLSLSFHPGVVSFHPTNHMCVHAHTHNATTYAKHTCK